ncbi:hypothetical protein NE237_012864 [Protea cynaroides]|uniref:ATG8-interacting protein 1 n=1 Tax=Protea cynaroides TaxID=273540 RepID=A0A9Q0GZW8_9MAGN|nr:hypothetical protein NE237_012864 [Protea cynaroides]
MADNEEGVETPSRGNEWEVVTLTASAYAAAPGPKKFESNDDMGHEFVEDDQETSRAMFMSRHFVVSPSQHEILPSEQDKSEIDNETKDMSVASNKVLGTDLEVGDRSDKKNDENWEMKGLTMAEEELFVASNKVPGMDLEVGDRSDKKSDENWEMKGLTMPEELSVASNKVPGMDFEVGDRSDKKNDENWDMKRLSMPEELPGMQFFDEKGNRLSVHGTEFEEATGLQGLNLVDEEHGIYSAAKFNSFHAEADNSGSSLYDENKVLGEPCGQESLNSPLEVSKSTSHNKKDEGVPCEAWWKRKAASLYAHAKETNAFWSIFVAAALMGIAIIGQRWRQERLQVQRLKWQFNVKEEKMNRMMGPFSRLKDVIVSGHSRGSAIRGSAEL